jgi:hypothetical protein
MGHQRVTKSLFFSSPEFRDCFPSKAIISLAVILLIPLIQLRKDLLNSSGLICENTR